jgi:hypothetical protein
MVDAEFDAEAAEASYFVESRWGGVEAEPIVRRMKQILVALDDRWPEHADPSLTHESGWTLTVHVNGSLVWQNDEQRFAPRHRLARDPNRDVASVERVGERGNRGPRA